MDIKCQILHFCAKKQVKRALPTMLTPRPQNAQAIWGTWPASQAGPKMRKYFVGTLPKGQADPVYQG